MVLSIVPTVEAVVSVDPNVQVDTRANALAAILPGAVKIDNEASIDVDINANAQFNPTIYFGDSTLIVVALPMIVVAIILVNASFSKLLLLAIGAFSAYDAHKGWPTRNTYLPLLSNTVQQYLPSPSPSPRQGNLAIAPPNPRSICNDPDVEILIQSKLLDPSKELSPEESIQVMIGCLEQAQRKNSEIIEECNKALVVIGNTGAGKSTFINYTHGCRMKKMKVEGVVGKVITTDTSLRRKSEVAEIGHGNVSSTYAPGISKLMHDGKALAIVDTPGFEDSRGAEINVSNMLNTLDAISKMTAAVVVVLVDYNSLTERRGDGFKSLLTTLKKFCGSDKDNNSSYKSILLCVTRTPQDEVRDRGELKTLKKSIIETLEENDFPLVEDNVFLYDPLDPLQAKDVAWNRQKILSKVNNMPMITKTNTFNSYMTDSDIQYISKIVKEVKQKIADSYKGDDFQSIRNQLLLLNKLHLLKDTAIDNDIQEAKLDMCCWIKNSAMKFCNESLKESNLVNAGMKAQKATEFLNRMMAELQLDTDTNHEALLIDAIREAEDEVKKSKDAIDEKRRLQSPAEAPLLRVSDIPVTDTSAYLVWNKPKSYTNITSYQVSVDGVVPSGDSDNSTERRLDNLEPGVSYKCRVCAKNNVPGLGSWSAPIIVKTTRTLPKSPINVKIGNRQDDSLTISWARPDQNKRAMETPIQSYKIVANGVLIVEEMYPDNPWKREHELKVDNLAPGQTYAFAIQCTNAAGTGDKSTESKGVTTNQVSEKITETENQIEDLDNDDKVMVYCKRFDDFDNSHIFKCTQFNGSFEADYQISRVTGPYKCFTFKQEILKEGGCKWRGNSMLNGKVTGTVKVYAKKRDKNHREIKELKKTVTVLKEAKSAMEKRAIGFSSDDEKSASWISSMVNW